jgi:hypothetical protein
MQSPCLMATGLFREREEEEEEEKETKRGRERVTQLTRELF